MVDGNIRLLTTEGYKMFYGVMTVTPLNNNPSRNILGDWLYKPDTRCWYCNCCSYPEEICSIHQILVPTSSQVDHFQEGYYNISR